MAREEESKSRMVALLASPGMGHLIPLGEFATRLAHHHNFSITIFSASDSDSTPSKAHNAYLHSLPDSIASIPLPAVHLHDQPANIRPETRVFLTMSLSVPHLRRAMKVLASISHVVALVVDLFGADALGVARQLRIGAYIFYPSTCTSLSLFFHLPHLDRTVAGEFRDLDVPIRLPGCVPINGRDIEDALQDRTDDSYELMLQHSWRFIASDGIFVNTFAAIEAGAITGSQGEGAIKDPPGVPRRPAHLSRRRRSA